jgi:bacillithiol biosynthesis cysteine-adding enzyme BshC
MKEISPEYRSQTEWTTQFFEQPLLPDWRELSQRVAERYNRPQIIQELIRQNAGLKTASGKLHLKYLQEKNTVIIITGQQLGLFVSPLYTVYKTISTLSLAERLNREIDAFHFAPVFWLESEDHDYAEVNHAFFWSKSGTLQKLEIAGDTEQTGHSVGQRRLPETALNVLTELQNHLQETEFSAALLQEIKRVFVPGRNWLDAFSDFLHDMFDAYGLLFFNPGCPEIKQFSRPFFDAVITGNDELFRRLDAQTALLRQNGFAVQVPLDARKSYLSIAYEAGRRQQIFRDDANSFFTRDPGRNWDKSQLLGLVQDNPQWFSSTVLTRPLWQSWLLPVISYIAGPAETAYWAQLRQAFNAFGLVMPQVQPRLSLTLVEPKVQRLLSKHQLNIHAIPDSMTTFLDAYYTQNRLSSLKSGFGNIRQQLDQSRAGFDDQAQQLDPTLTPLVQKTFESIHSQLIRLESRFIKQAGESDQLTLRQLQHIHESLFPAGKPQERVISPVYFLNKYGRKWLDEIYRKTIGGELESGYYYLS